MSSITIFSCGDIVNTLHPNGLICSEETERFISSADFSVCNFEAPIQGVGSPQPKSGPHISQSPGTIAGLKKQGFDLLLLANNHIMDFGASALEATIDTAERQGMETIGAGMNFEDAYQPLIKEINGIAVGFVNACEAQFGAIDYFKGSNEAGYSWINHQKIDEIISTTKSKCDFLIFYAHAGLENYPIPLKDWRTRYARICDLGADVVIASHPHVPQGYEQYKNSLIFYSVGNFYFDHFEKKIKNTTKDKSYSVTLHLEKGYQPRFALYFHATQNGLVTPIDKDMTAEIQKLNDLLTNDIYEKAHDKMSLEAYEAISTSLRYSLMPGFFDGNIKTSIKRLASLALGRSRKIPKELLQLHLLRNDTYSYATRHALEAKLKGISKS
ncbi:CapA family protein [Geopseudomonas aromaticivorans]